ncbi:MAG: acyclic terpene utilization AtuA family protein [Bacteroidota bacterium]
MSSDSIRIAGGQGFYGDSSRAAFAIVKEKAADVVVFDALAELTLSILQKDKLKDPELGYARDIEFMAANLYPLAYKNGIKIVANSGGLNPKSAAKRVAAILQKQGIKGLRIATITGDDFLPMLDQLQSKGHKLENLETNQSFLSVKYQPTHANVYIGASSIVKALDLGADIILAGRVADPCLTLGVLAYHFGWKLSGNGGEGKCRDTVQADLDKLASGIAIGHLLECTGQASGGNSYAEWPMDYKLSNLGYPIAEVTEDGSAIFSKLKSQGGKISRNTLREQLIYEIHDPANYITPDVIVDLTEVKIEDIEENKVKFSGVKGKPRPGKLKMTIGLMEGYLSEQFFFFSWPYAYQKAQKFIKAVEEIWNDLPFKIERFEYSFVGINGIHGNAAPMPSEEDIERLNEIGVRLVIKNNEPKAGKIAMQAIVCLGLNGPPGIVGIPGWGRTNSVMLSLWPTLIPRELVEEKVEILEI